MLAWVLAAGAVLCLAYFIVIMLYSGIGTSFAVIWLLTGGFLGAAAMGAHHYQRYPEKAALWIPVSLVTLCASGLIVVMVVQILIFGRVPRTAEPDLDYVIVLGASVKPDHLSKTLKLRLDKAAEYAAQNPRTVLVLSGAQGAGEPTTEAAAMKNYLLEQGVLEEQMRLEERSHSTLENIAYSRILIDEDRAGEEPAKIGVLTSNFHLYRACMIAKKQGLTGVYGIAAPSDRVLFLHFCFRDCIAILKDRLVGNL